MFIFLLIFQINSKEMCEVRNGLFTPKNLAVVRSEGILITRQGISGIKT
jgi:hypothetical protein